MKTYRRADVCTAKQMLLPPPRTHRQGLGVSRATVAEGNLGRFRVATLVACMPLPHTIAAEQRSKGHAGLAHGWMENNVSITASSVK